MSFRFTYEERAEADFAGVQEQLSAMAASCTGTFEAEVESRQRDIQSKHSEALHRLRMLKAADSGGWGAVMIAFENAWSELSVALRR